MGKILLFILAITLFITFLGVSACINNDRIDSWLERARDSGNPQQTVEFLTNYKEALTQNDMIAGKYKSIFKYPATKMDVYIRTIDGLADRAKELSKMVSTDTSYQMGLLNLEKDLGDVDTAASSVWRASGGWILVLFIIIMWLATIVTSITYAERS